MRFVCQVLVFIVPTAQVIVPECTAGDTLTAPAQVIVPECTTRYTVIAQVIVPERTTRYTVIAQGGLCILNVSASLVLRVDLNRNKNI